MDLKLIVKALATVVLLMIVGWMGWVSNVALQAGNKIEWMRSMQDDINKLQEEVYRSHGN